MKIKKKRMLIAFLPANVFLALGIIFLIITLRSSDFIQLAYLMISIISFMLSFTGIRPILLYFDKRKILEYVETRYNKIVRLKDEIMESQNIESIYKNKDGTPTIYIKEAQEALSELGYNGDNFIDMLYDGILTITDIITPIEILIEETNKPFKRIPYQFVMLVR